MRPAPEACSVAVAMSGGVDSSLAALLLKEEGREVRGFFLALAQPDLDAQVERVRRIAAGLAIPLEVVDGRAAFQEQVLATFTTSLLAGRTPNPCAVCNRLIKFGLLYDHVRGRGMQFLATGHYARIAFDPAGRPCLCRGSDLRKDQSYFLARLDAGRLGGILFPHGGRSKEEVYRLAASYGLPHEPSDESQDVCFLKGADIATFLARRGAKDALVPGAIVNTDGREIGRHHGIGLYTVGQRRGLGIAAATPLYVLKLDAPQNLLVVGKNDELAARGCRVREINWLLSPPPLPCRLQVQLRYRHWPAPATIDRGPTADSLDICFDKEQRAVTPGQFAVFYDGDRVAGSGEIL